MRSGLRTRLLLNLLPFIILLLATGVYAIVLFSRQANQVESTVTGNYQSILIAQSMRLELSSMEKEAWFSMSRTNGLSPEFWENQQEFEDNFTALTNRATLSDEIELLDALDEDYQLFTAMVRALDAPNSERRERQFYQVQLFPRVIAIDATLKRIRDVNDAEVLAAGQSIRKITASITRLMLMGMAVAVLLTGYACLQLSRSILKPIQALTAATREVGEGKWRGPVRIPSHDELGELGTSFNTMAEQLQEYRQSTTDQIVHLHRTFEGTLASFPDPIFILNHTGEIEVQNPSAREFLRALDPSGQLPQELRSACQHALESDEHFLPHSYENAVSYRVGGAERFYLPRILTIHDKHQALTGVALVLYDVTRFRLLDAAKTNLLATVSHELKTPLTGVRMTLHLLLDRTLGPIPPKQHELLAGARDDVERLLRILQDLLDLARLDEGITELNRKPTQLYKLLQSAVEQVSELAAANRLHLEVTAEPNLPEVWLDQHRMGHVLYNLMANAIKHSPTGGRITLGAALVDEVAVRVTVTDEGKGIPKRYQSRVFDRFFRVPDQSQDGVGLGLSIAREITVAHGGRIAVKSQEGLGSQFDVFLPIRGSRSDGSSDRSVTSTLGAVCSSPPAYRPEGGMLRVGVRDGRTS